MSQFNLLQMVSQHKEHCLREVCNCKQENLYDDKHQLNIDLVMNIIDTVFRDCMQSKTATKNRAIREHLFLKYITFISKFQRNPLRSYYELKKYYKMYPKDNSSYFIGVCQVLAKTFKQMITANQELLYSTQKIEQRSTFNSKITLTIKEILKTFEIQNALVPLLSKYTQKKIQHFKQLKTSVSSMDTLRIISKDLYTKFMYLKHQFSQYSQSFSKITKLEPNFILQKIIIYNEVKKPLHLERQMMHLIQKGSARPMDELNSFNLIKGNIISIFTSVNQNYKILNQPNSSLTNFFGYNQIEFSSIKKIEDLMPPYISNIHSQLVNGFIHSGQSPFLSICNRVFSINKYGFIFPVNLQISINYSFQDDFRMSATLLKLISQKGYIVFNQSGSIKGIDKNFFSSFFDLKILEENENFQENTQNVDLFDYF